MIKKIFYYFLKSIVLYLSMLFPRNRKLIIFGAWFGDKYDDNSRYFYEYILLNRPDIDVYWITKNISIYEKLKEEKKPVYLSNTPKSILLTLRAKYICTSTGIGDIGELNVNVTGGAYLINLWHGLPLKKIMYDDEYSKNAKNNLKNKILYYLKFFPRRHEFVVSTSDKISQIYESAFRLKKNHIIQLGQPRNDYFFQEHINKYKERFKDKKIILYMPTHRNEGKTEIKIDELFDLKILDKWCSDNNYVFVIKKHFYHSKEKVISTSFENIVEITNEVTESQVLLDATDILITDYSSCYIDYLLLDRPIIFFDYDLENYKKEDRKMYFEYDEVTPGEKCEDFNQLYNVIQRISIGEDRYSSERLRVKNIFYGYENQSITSEKLLNVLLELPRKHAKFWKDKDDDNKYIK